MEKMTKKVAFTQIKDILKHSSNDYYDIEQLIATIDNEIALLEKKASVKRESKTTIENRGIATELYNAIAEYPNGVTIKELIKLVQFNDYTSQKVSGIIRSHLLNSETHKVYRKEIKGVAYFSVNE